ncbi:hypothetical protein [Poseidonocella sp. HB161398]|uniref:hypothetical protein n=1 Tax=Poseidonocella sp. HB161398 TaxID=2320855 RepID=UPI001108EBE4|nr:hypothetical protein [Poseidonocella sp. HB161398]
MGKVNAGNPVPTGGGGAPGSLFPGTPCRFMNQDGFSATSPGAGGAGAIANSVNDDFAGGTGGDGLIILIPYF